MSSGVSGKFQDHYITLGIDPQADSDTIQAAYAKLVQKYHPSNTETGDAAKFETLNVAYEVLSDPVLRASFDQVKGVDQEKGDPKFSGERFFDALLQGNLLRSAILCVLYDRRQLKAFKPSLSMRHMEGILRVTSEELLFAIWYLKQRGMVVTDDKSSMEITVDGMDWLEKNQPSREGVMSFIKPESVTAPDRRQAQDRRQEPAQAPKQEPKLEQRQEPALEPKNDAPVAPESLMNLLNRNRRVTDVVR